MRNAPLASLPLLTAAETGANVGGVLRAPTWGNAAVALLWVAALLGALLLVATCWERDRP